MKVSTVIPTYNRRTQVLGAIASVLRQTVPVDEIIVVDDGSTDGTPECIRDRFGSSVKVVQQKNAGAAAARNRGIREAQGEWIAFLDSDDVWLPTKIERQTDILARFGDQVGLCFTDCVFTGDPALTLSVFGVTGFTGQPATGLLEEPARHIVARRDPLWLQSVMARRSLLMEIDGFDETLLLGEDTDLFLRLSFKAKFCYVGEALVQVDRTPSRSVGICNVYATREDRLLSSLEQLFSKFLAMPEMAGTEHEQPLRELLRDAYYNSVECKLHQLRIVPALREMGRLREVGDGYSSILANLMLRKMKKLRRKMRAPNLRGAGKAGESGMEAV